MRRGSAKGYDVETGLGATTGAAGRGKRLTFRDGWQRSVVAGMPPKMLEHGRERAYLDRMSLSEIDGWIGRTLFVPPIIRLCQLTRQSQFAVSRLFWFIAALDGFYRAQTLFSSILWGGMSVLMMFTASQRADHPTVSFMLFRLLAMAFLALDLLKGMAMGQWAGLEFWIFVLIAEYAATIRTIPPRDYGERKARPSAEAGNQTP